ncbi:MAG: HAMP domain-containing histidine kinase [Gammaproteobacteria bacterium]|nr:HAMP domain-containing histidine kinase [Gammaproteobacteria bacterium]
MAFSLSIRIKSIAARLKNRFAGDSYPGKHDSAILVALASAGLALGLLVLLGWVLNISTLFQLRSDWVPMQFNTALGFILANCAILAHWLRYDTITRTLAFLLLALSSLTLAQYISHTDLGIDQLFMDAYVTTKTSHPGRMAPNTATCFLMAGLGLILISSQQHYRYSFNMLVLLISTVIAAISYSALYGYLAGPVNTFDWGAYTLMAVHTATGFVLLSTALALIARHHVQMFGRRYKTRGLAGLWLIGAAIVLNIWFAIHDKEYRYLKNLTESAGKSFALAIQTNYRNDILALGRMRDRVLQHGQKNFAYWEQDTHRYRNDLPELSAVIISDHRRRIYREKGFNPFKREHIQELAESIQQDRATHLLVDTGDGSHYLVSTYRLWDDTSSMIALIRLDALVLATLKRHTDEYEVGKNISISIFHDGKMLYQSTASHTGINSVLGTYLPVMLGTLELDSHYSPDQEFFINTFSGNSQFVVIAGFLMNTLLLLVLDSQRMFRRISEALAGTNAQLTREIAERERAEKVKDDFLSTISHELRTPLTSIQGAIKLIKHGNIDITAASGTELLGIADRNSDRLLELINELLDAAKMQAGTLSLSRKPFDLTEALSEACETGAILASRYNVRLAMPDITLQMPVYGDRGRIIQVFFNIISNAIRHTRKHTEVHIDTCDAGQGWRIDIKDQGEGIPEEFRGRIFERFTQANTSTTRQSGGTGLGLNISKSIVESHGGQIGFSSSGSGTTFFVILPKYRSGHDA